MEMSSTLLLTYGSCRSCMPTMESTVRWCSTRVREPLDYYLSFYKWGVAFRQRESPQHFEGTFRVGREGTESAIDDDDTEHGGDGDEYHIDQYKMHYNMNNVIGKTPELAWERLIKFLDQFTIVATMQRFDESLLLLMTW